MVVLVDLVVKSVFKSFVFQLLKRQHVMSKQISSQALSQLEIMQFVAECDKAGIDPNQTSVDIVYKSLVPRTVAEVNLKCKP